MKIQSVILLYLSGRLPRWTQCYKFELFQQVCIIITTMNGYFQSNSCNNKQGGSHKDKNIQFLRLLDKTYVDEIRNNTPRLKEHLKKVRTKLQRLTIHEQQEWAQTWYLKCKAISTVDMELQFAVAIKTLVSVSNQGRVEYDREGAQELLKRFYFNKYGHEIVEIFSRAGYSVSQYQTLEYDDPWYSKLFTSIVSIF